ncbi:MAG TPA: hypothetical protein VKE70_21545 [Candidatus Solibacter sp.]|nr:hypothetical protein [Candidatus Solibacter sp.]
MTKMGIWKYLALLIAAPCWGGILSVTLNPVDGALTGAPGGGVVWGVQAVNTDAAYWLLITSVQAPVYAGTGAPGEIPDGPNAFTDYLSVYVSNNFLALGPGGVIDRGFSVGTPTVGDPSTTGIGLASLAISPTAAAGTVFAPILIFYDVYDGDPFSDGTNFVESQETDVLTSVTVDQAGTPPADAPEPAAWWTIGAALPVILLRRRRTKVCEIL